MNMIEAGVRFGRPGVSRLSGGVAASYSRWNNIQADLNGDDGPYTANIGDGRIIGLESNLAWRLNLSLTASATVFLNNSRLTHPVAWLDAAAREMLPHAPRVTARAALDYQMALDSRSTLRVSGFARYVGRSWLGVGSDLHIPQGDYLDLGLTSEISRGRVAASVQVSNLLDTAGNRFAYGNPFGVTRRSQETPLQPRTIRVGLRAGF